MGWLDRQFRRQPYPDMTYKEALRTAEVVAWNIGTKDAMSVWEDLVSARTAMFQAHPVFESRSKQPVTALNELWRGKVITLLTWFKKEGAK